MAPLPWIMPLWGGAGVATHGDTTTMKREEAATVRACAVSAFPTDMAKGFGFATHILIICIDRRTIQSGTGHCHALVPVCHSTPGREGRE